MIFKALLIDVDETVPRRAIDLVRIRRIEAPLAEPAHFLRYVQFLAALGLDDPNYAVGRAYDEIRRVIRQFAVRFHIVELEADGHVVLRERLHVGRGIEKCGEGQFETVGFAFTDDAVKHGFLRGEVGARLSAEWSCVA
jgi:hypothetical protein